MKLFQGVVTSKVPEKNLGYISCEAEGRDFFFHASGVRRDAYDDIEPGDEVRFTVINTAKGEKAVGIEKC